MEKKTRTRTVRGTVEGVSALAMVLLRDFSLMEARDYLTDAGVPAKILEDGLFLAASKRLARHGSNLNLELTNEENATEQVEVSEAVSQRSAQDETGESRKPASRRNSPVNGVLPSA